MKRVRIAAVTLLAACSGDSSKPGDWSCEPPSIRANWLAPSENTDGSPLLDLAGFKLYWGTAPGLYSRSAAIENPGATSFLIEQLEPGAIYYLAMTAHNVAGIPSDFSNEIERQAPGDCS